MDKIQPISPNEFKLLPNDFHQLILTSYFWINPTFTTCYRFLFFPLRDERRQKLIIIHAHNPLVLENDFYSMERDLANEKMRISFLQSDYLVENIKEFRGFHEAFILHLIDQDGKSHNLYSAVKDPFSERIKRIYAEVK